MKANPGWAFFAAVTLVGVSATASARPLTLKQQAAEKDARIAHLSAQVRSLSEQVSRLRALLPPPAAPPLPLPASPLKAQKMMPPVKASAFPPPPAPTKEGILDGLVGSGKLLKIQTKSGRHLLATLQGHTDAGYLFEQMHFEGAVPVFFPGTPSVGPLKSDDEALHLLRTDVSQFLNRRIHAVASGEMTVKPNDIESLEWIVYPGSGDSPPPPAPPPVSEPRAQPGVQFVPLWQ